MKKGCYGYLSIMWPAFLAFCTGRAVQKAAETLVTNNYDVQNNFMIYKNNFFVQF